MNIRLTLLSENISISLGAAEFGTVGAPPPPSFGGELVCVGLGPAPPVVGLLVPDMVDGLLVPGAVDGLLLPLLDEPWPGPAPPVVGLLDPDVADGLLSPLLAELWPGLAGSLGPVPQGGGVL